MGSILQRIAYIEAETDAIKRRYVTRTLLQRLRNGELHISDLYDVELVLPEKLDFLKYANVIVSITSKLDALSYVRLYFAGDNISYRNNVYLVGVNAFETRQITNQLVANFPGEAKVVIRVGWSEFVYKIEKSIIV